MEPTTQDPIVIIGAGLTGLATALFLEHQGITNYAIYEKNTQVGGLCRTVHKNGYTFDFTGHFLHINNKKTPELLDLFFPLNQWKKHTRYAQIYSHNRFVDYPYQQNLYGLPKKVIDECVNGFINKPQINHPTAYTDWVMTQFGAGFAQHFFYPYQEKIFSYPIEKLSSSWVQHFVPSTSLEDIKAGLENPHTRKKVGYNAEFYYPHCGGIQTMIERLAQKIKNPIHTNKKVINIDQHAKTITFEDQTNTHYSTIINTSPLPELASILSNNQKSTVLVDAATKLAWSRIININLGLDCPLPEHPINNKTRPPHWVYYPETHYPFYRACFPYLLDQAMVSAKKSSISIEVSIPHTQKDCSWGTITENTLNTMPYFKKINNLSSVIESAACLYLPYAYVTFNTWYDQNIPRIHEELEKLNIHSIGRYGGWKYTSMEDNLWDAYNTVQLITKH
jgi:protoporphyrinogen oxidase